jgi:hypothetical protein
MNEFEQKNAPCLEAINLNQVILAPLDVEKHIPIGHPARNLWEFLGRLEFSQFSTDFKSVEGKAGRSGSCSSRCWAF